jgi:choline-glycine betaine transporter
LIASLPLLFIGVAMAVSLFKSLHADDKKDGLENEK